MKKTILIVSSSIVFIMLLLMFLIAGVSLLGIKTYKHTNGSLVYVSNTNGNDLKISDRVFFYLDDSSKTATGNIRGISEENGCYYIFASDISLSEEVSSDLLVPIMFEQVCGKVLFSLPLLGFFSEFLSSKTGFAIGLFITLTFSLTIAFSSFIPESKKKHKRRSRYVMIIPSQENVVYESLVPNEDLPSKEKKNEDAVENTQTDTVCEDGFSNKNEGTIQNTVNQQ